MNISRGDKLATMEVLNLTMESAILQGKSDRVMSAGAAYLRYYEETQEEDFDFEIAIKVLEADNDQAALWSVTKESEEQESEEI